MFDLPKLEVRSTGSGRDASVKLNGIELTDLALRSIRVELGVEPELPTLTAEFVLGEVVMDAEVALNLIGTLIDKDLLTITEPPEEGEEPPYEVDDEGRSLSS